MDLVVVQERACLMLDLTTTIVPDDHRIDSHSVTSSRKEASNSARSRGQGETSIIVHTSNRVDTGSSTEPHGYGTSRGHVYPAAVYGFYRNRDGEPESFGDKVIKFEDKAWNWLNGGPFEVPGNSGPSHHSRHSHRSNRSRRSHHSRRR